MIGEGVDLRRLHASKAGGGRPRLATRLIGNETIIVPVSSGVGNLDAIYTLNALGSRIWQLIDGSTPVLHIIDTIHTEYAVPRDVATRDVLEFLEELSLRKLIIIADGPAEGEPR